MKFYLSSFKIGNEPEKLKNLFLGNKKIGYIPNACDYTQVDFEKRNARNAGDIKDLESIGLHVEMLDLRDYFSKTDELRKKLNSLGGVFVRGGNTFILRQSMQLSGFDFIFKELLTKKDFVYSGYSAGICVLAPSLTALQTVDDPTDFPYPEIQTPIFDGLEILNYMILPHYKSDHPESADIEKEVMYCIENKIPFITLKDGEVLILEK